MLNCAFTLFSGTALTWFRAIRDSVFTWKDLTNKLRETYLSAEYEKDVWQDIRTRTQGVAEKCAIYIAVMQNLFNKLRSKPSENTCLKIIRRNMLPFIQNQLALSTIRTIDQLISKSRQVEDVYLRSLRIKPPPSQPNLVTETDLMYRKPRGQVNIVSEVGGREPIGSSRSVCYNYREIGHFKRNCPHPPVRRCFKCGRLGQTIRSCACGSGNGVTSRDIVGSQTRKN